MTSRFTDLDRPGLDVVALRAALCGPDGDYHRVDVVDETGSTNADLIAAGAKDPAAWPDRSILIAEHQNHAKGRADRVWTSPPKSGLAVSVLLRPVTKTGRPLPTNTYSWLPLLAGLALVTTLRRHAEVDAELKWPNDVQVADAKLAGILSQLGGTVEGAPPPVVIGTGLNVSTTRDELPVPTATSLAVLGAASTNRTILLTDYLRTFSRLYGDFCAVDGDSDADLSGARDSEAPLPGGRSLRRQVAAAMVTLGRRVRAELPGGGELIGTAERIGDGGTLIVVDEAGQEQVIAAADIVHLRSLGAG